jgi:hypothetical protein
VNSRIIASIFGSCSLVILFADGAFAQQRTFVSGFGSDSSPCSRTAPCRTFAQAISQTNSGGEVIVLDSAGYGAFSITKPVSIISPPGVYAGISVFSGDGIDINAGASDTVILRGLTVNNQGSEGAGIVFHTGGALRVENCVINGFSTLNANAGGLRFLGSGSLDVKDSIMRGNRHGILLQPSSGTAQATIDEVRLESGQVGLVAAEGSVVNVRNSVASANSDDGFDVVSFTAGSVRLSLEGCIVSNNANDGIFALPGSTGAVEVNAERCVVSGNLQAGIVAQGGSTGVATVTLSNSIVTGNGVGIENAGSPAVILSRGNNTVEANTSNTSGTIGSYTAK